MDLLFNDCLFYAFHMQILINSLRHSLRHLEVAGILTSYYLVCADCSAACGDSRSELKLRFYLLIVVYANKGYLIDVLCLILHKIQLYVFVLCIFIIKFVKNKTVNQIKSKDNMKKTLVNKHITQFRMPLSFIMSVLYPYEVIDIQISISNCNINVLLVVTQRTGFGITQLNFI